METSKQNTQPTRKPESNGSVMLSIAREIIDCRAVRDGYQPGEYDAVRDEEGYVTSILNVMHHWCMKNDIDWDDELDRALAFFESDL